jgi:hypothetical protein
LPAHRRCNNFSAREEEAFRNHISTAIPPDEGGRTPLWEKTWRAIHRPEAKGMQTVFYRDMLALPVIDEYGVVRAEPFVARLKYERADRVLAKIVKGLFTWKTGDILPNEGVRWRFGQAEKGREGVSMPHAFEVHDVLEVRWGRAADEPLVTLWTLGFHRTAWFWVMTVPAHRDVGGLERDAKVMVWPGPENSR